MGKLDQSAEEQQRIWDAIQRRRIEERIEERKRLEVEEEHLRLAEEQERILEEIKRKEKERKTEEELSMKLILQMTSRERQVPAAAAPPSPNQSVKFPPQQQMQRGMTGGRAKVDEVLGWQEVKRSGRGESQGRNTNWPPLGTSESSFKGECGSSGSQRAGGLRDIGQDMSKGEGKGFKSHYKTVLCEFWNTTGRCQYGAGCHFAHGESELKRQREVNRVQQTQQQMPKQMHQQRSKKEGRVAGGTALKSEEQRRAADKVHFQFFSCI